MQSPFNSIPPPPSGPPLAQVPSQAESPFATTPFTPFEETVPEDGEHTSTDPELDAIAWCLENEGEALRVMRRYFADHTGKSGLTGMRAKDMVPKLEQELGVGAVCSPYLETLFARFDFNGNGRLDEAEFVKMFTISLKHSWVARTGTPTEDVKVRETTLEDAGYTVEKELGKGGQVLAYLASHQMSNSRYCIKVYTKGDAHAFGLEELREEFAIMHQLRHENIARTYEVFQDHSNYYLVNQPCFGGDLSEIGTHIVGKVNITERWWKAIFAQCLDGLTYLHGHAIMHCDIKEATIKVACNDSFRAPQILLTDFSLATGFLDEGTGAKGTPGYIPPETWQTKIWYPRGDIFSLGVVFFQLLTGLVPTAHNRVPGLFTYGAKSVEDVARFTQDRDPELDNFPQWEQAKDLVQSMLRKHRTERPVAPVACKHDWFNADLDREFPRENAYNLYGRATEALSRRAILEQLEEQNNLRKLRRLEMKLDGLANSMGMISVSGFQKLMCYAGVAEDDVREYCSVAEDENKRVPYQQILHDAINSKGKYTDKDVLDMFVVADLDRKGYLQKEEVAALFQNDFFEVGFDDVEQLMSQMDMDDDGNIDFAEFRRAVLDDGRICRRSDVTARARLKRSCTNGCQSAPCVIS
mmetsp:Transcript_27018/g.62406  ORF Transcript_27018/g.62406 Transcript_27018/m.62406 type:complete len:640 (-) Transcript_27018:2-1921(-)